MLKENNYLSNQGETIGMLVMALFFMGNKTKYMFKEIRSNNNLSKLKESNQSEEDLIHSKLKLNNQLFKMISNIEMEFRLENL